MHRSRRRLLRRGLEFHVCTINKSAHTKKVWKLIVCTSHVCLFVVGVFVYLFCFVFLGGIFCFVWIHITDLCLFLCCWVFLFICSVLFFLWGSCVFFLFFVNVLQWLVGWLVGFYGISTFVGYLMPNPFLYK